MTLLRALLPKLSKILRVTYGMNFQRSLQPFLEAYFNFGRMLVETFSKVGLIDKTHPWLRSTMRARPLQVLSYACAKADWKKPLALPTVMAASITLMVACGTLATTGLVTSSMLGAGEAYASMFAAPSPGTDLALKYMSNSFGVSIPGVPLATIDGVVGGFQRMMALYSMCMLVLAGFILLYILMSAIAATAHEGRFGGSGFNQIWAPIRLVVAIGLLVPLPMAGGYNGYNSGQYIVMKVAEWGSGMASSLWVPFATALANRGDVIGTPSVEPAATAVRGVMLNEFCKARYNIIVNTIPLVGEPLVAINQITANGRIVNYYTTSADVQSSYCGITYYEKAIGANTMAASISNGFETAYNNMRTAVEAFTTTLNSPAYIDIYTALPAAGQEAATKAFFTTEFVNIVNQYQQDLATAINNTIATQTSQATDAMTTAVEQQGWAGASVWFNTIARLNAEVMAAARAMPTSQPPSLTSTAGAITADVCASSTTAHTCSVAKGLELVKQFADNIPAIYPSISYALNTGAGAVGNVATPAVMAGLSQGLDNSGTVGGNLTGAIGTAINWVLTNTFVGGPFGSIGMGTEASLSQVNPLAQLAQIGDWLINKCLILLGLGAVAPGGAKILLIALGMMGFGAGVLLFYVTPLMPFIRLLFGVAGWLLNILEAVIAIPLVAVAHLTSKGEGLSGDLARTAYFMVLSIFLRPALLIVGMVIALMMFSICIGILNDLYKSAVTGFMGTATGNANGGLSIIMYTVMYVAIAYGLCNLCFKLIEEIPNRAMTWINQNAAREIHQDEQVSQALTGTGNSFVAVGRDFATRGIGAASPGAAARQLGR